LATVCFWFKVRDGETRGVVTNVLGNQAQMLLLHRDPFSERSVFKDAGWALIYQWEANNGKPHWSV
jgi:hypothetical protein